MTGKARGGSFWDFKPPYTERWQRKKKGQKKSGKSKMSPGSSVLYENLLKEDTIEFCKKLL